ncbi:adenine DNA glycosylase, partial [Cynoglossus semilaevis]|uniref:adenine DNA glycosylase n=1 Tax=Cynoglossus semilaevis TaxID=244447 RepID=UPI000496FFDC
MRSCRLISAMQKNKRTERRTKESVRPQRKKTKREEDAGNVNSPPRYHTFSDPAHIELLRSQLLTWYDEEKRELPWRSLALTEPDVDIRTYGVWVSEIMLQQTQVATVIDYYNKWMKVDFVAGAVDGNVIRVLCRLRAIGADSTSPAVTEALWGLANALVDRERPGDFNQAMMELGARVCTPKAPVCSQCPVQTHCHSYSKVQVKQKENSERLLGKPEKKLLVLSDIEDCMNSGNCPLCPSEPWDDDLGVQNFPRKPAKKPPRVERTLTCVVVRHGEDGEDEFLLRQRPDKGLLAGLWQFPSLLLEEGKSEMKQKRALCSELSGTLGSSLNQSLLHYVGEVVHIFSHIHQTYVVHAVQLHDTDATTQAENAQWISRSALQIAAVSTGVKKILKLYDSMDSQREHTAKKDKKKNTTRVKTEEKPKTTKRPRLAPANHGGRQLSLSSFFKTVKEES